MSLKSCYDVAVIGGGIIGTATAMELMENRSISLVLIEAESRLAAHQTGHNSGVIHSGLYYKPGSLKAKNCARGRKLLTGFCDTHKIPYRLCGKIVVAVNNEEANRLEELAKRGEQNGLTGIKHLKAEELKEYEPYVTGVAALHVPQTGIVDFKKVTEKYGEIIEKRGGVIKLNSRINSLTRKKSELILHTDKEEIRCKHLINCAGLQSDRVAKMCGVEPDLKIIPFRGEYFELLPGKTGMVRNLIYPVPDPRFPFLGVHFTRTIDGKVEAGPNAVLALKRHGYKKTNFSLKDMGETLLFTGFLRMATKYWRMGLGEMHRSFSKAAFVKALNRLMPQLEARDLKPGNSGVRAQALAPDGNMVDDFHILETEDMVHVLNAPSPAATASLSIGKLIAEKALRNFNL